MTRLVVVGSGNPVKVEATRRGFRAVFPGEEHEVSGVAVPSAVSDQPRGEAETRRGARNRAAAAAERVRAGQELGPADDEVFGREDSKRAEGAVGLLTGDAFTRTELYAQAVCLALAPFIHPELYGR